MTKWSNTQSRRWATPPYNSMFGKGFNRLLVFQQGFQWGGSSATRNNSRTCEAGVALYARNTLESVAWSPSIDANCWWAAIASACTRMAGSRDCSGLQLQKHGFANPLVAPPLALIIRFFGREAVHGSHPSGLNQSYVRSVSERRIAYLAAWEIEDETPFGRY